MHNIVVKAREEKKRAYVRRENDPLSAVVACSLMNILQQSCQLDRVVPITQRTFESTPWPWPRIGGDRSCIRGRSLGREGRRDWGRSTWSRWRGGLPLKGLALFPFRHYMIMRRRGGLTFGYGKSRAPLVTQDIQANASVGVNVGMIDTCGEVNFGGLKWVVGGEVNGQEENAAGVW